MSYLQFYKLIQEPFANGPASKFYFNSDQHSQALARLMYAASSMKGLATLIGDIGTGKTTLARKMLDSLPEDEYEVALLIMIHAGIDAHWLLKRLCDQLGVNEQEADKVKLIGKLHERLVQINNDGKKTVVLIDEAQMLSTKEIMEEFRGLLNMESAGSKLITFIFCGLPDLEKTLELDPPLAQRVAIKVKLEHLNNNSTKSYIKYRLRMVGGNQSLFDEDALDQIVQASQGVPRLINTICDNALFEGFILKAEKITKGIVENVIGDLGLSTSGFGAIGPSVLNHYMPSDVAAGKISSQTQGIDEIDALLQSMEDDLA